MRVQTVQRLERLATEVALVHLQFGVKCAFCSRVGDGAGRRGTTSGNATVNGNGRNNAECMDCLSYGVSVDTLVASAAFNVLSNRRSHFELVRAQRALHIARTVDFRLVGTVDLRGQMI